MDDPDDAADAVAVFVESEADVEDDPEERDQEREDRLVLSDFAARGWIVFTSGNGSERGAVARATAGSRGCVDVSSSAVIPAGSPAVTGKLVWVAAAAPSTVGAVR